jgi:hypothetical protein
MGKKFWFWFLILAIAGLAIHFQFWQFSAEEFLEEDIYFIWLDGKRIAIGENPYARVLESNLRVNDKYATYFPLIYLLSALANTLGLTEFQDWLLIWRPLSYGFHMGIVGLMLRSFQQRGALLVGLVAAVVMLLGRWSLYIVRVHHIEFAAIFFLLLSLVLFPKKKHASLILYSVSLGIKQIGIFLLPVYLIYYCRQRTASDPLMKTALLGSALILSIPFITSIPFLLWNAEGYVKSILFSATRLGIIHIDGAWSFDLFVAAVFPGFVGFKAKLLMLFLMACVYLSAWQGRLQLLMASAMTMMLFVYFNSVLFLQYFIWPLSLTWLAFADLLPLSGPSDRRWSGRPRPVADRPLTASISAKSELKIAASDRSQDW